MKTVVIRTIKFIGSKKVFLINGSIWVSALDISYCLGNIGLSTRTPFMLLIGSTLSFEEFEVEAGEEVETSAGKKITFKKAGTKRLNWEIAQMSPRLEEKFFSVALDTMDFMGSSATSTSGQSTSVQEVSTEEVPDDVME
jgi:hypothetical protein